MASGRGARRTKTRADAFELLRGVELAPITEADNTTLERLDREPAQHRVDVAWDGLRVLVAKVDEDVRVRGVGGRDWTAAFGAIATAVRALPSERLLFEGVLCALDAAARPDFAALRAHVAGTPQRLALMTWDLLIDGVDDLRARPLDERLARLAAVMAGKKEPLVLPLELVAQAAALKKTLAQAGMPGFVIRSRSAPYPARGQREEGALACVGAEGRAVPRWDRGLSPPPPLTNRDKVLYPRDGLRKQDLAAYYDEVAPLLLPLMAGRPIVAQRYPDGIDDFTWYQHRPPPRAPDYVTWALHEGDRRLLIESRDALLFMVNQAALVFHGWTSRAAQSAREREPDWAILDLDPGEATRWSTTVEVARAVHRLLELLELPSVLKTSGQKGLHVLIPLAQGHSADEAHQLALGLARMIERLMPADVTLETDREKRRGRLFLDHLQNFAGKTLVLPYSLRAADGAPFSAPIRWAELSASLEPRSFNLHTLRARLDAVGDLAQPLLGPGVSIRAALAKLAAGPR